MSEQIKEPIDDGILKKIAREAFNQFTDICGTYIEFEDLSEFLLKHYIEEKAKFKDNKDKNKWMKSNHPKTIEELFDRIEIDANNGIIFDKRIYKNFLIEILEFLN